MKLPSFLARKRKSRFSPKKNHFFDRAPKKIYTRKKKNTLQFWKQSSLAFSSPHKKIIRFLAIPLILFTLIFFLFFSPVFRVQDIFISREGTIPSINRAYESIDTIRGKNLFLLSGDDIAQKIQKAQPSLEFIEVQKSLPGNITIKLSSFPIIFQSTNILILSNGSIISQDENESDLSEIPYLYIAQESTILEKSIDPNTIQKLKNIFSGFQSRFPEIPLVYSEYFPDEDELVIGLKNKTLLIFSLWDDISRQLGQIQLYHEQKASITETPLVYIDGRIEKKLFICPLTEEYLCKKNISELYSPDIFTHLEEALSQITLLDLNPDNPENTDDPQVE